MRIYYLASFYLSLLTINVIFILEDPTNWWNWASLVFCSFMAIVGYLIVRD